MESTDHHRVVDPRSDPKEEEEKVERFYALIREARNRQRVEIERERKRRRVDEKRGGGGWIPAFKSEDFRDQADIRPPAVESEIENRQPVAAASASASAGNESNGGDEKVTIVGRVQKEDGLDLKLHL
ncbi:hypothetical protein Droror1_Dr00003770 [Drosera rotundifolia]